MTLTHAQMRCILSAIESERHIVLTMDDADITKKKRAKWLSDLDAVADHLYKAVPSVS